MAATMNRQGKLTASDFGRDHTKLTLKFQRRHDRITDVAAEGRQQLVLLCILNSLRDSRLSEPFFERNNGSNDGLRMEALQVF
jgi:hypothetical protein